MVRAVNPYIAGNPVGNSAAFVGRDDVLEAVLGFLQDPQHHGVVLYGQRRVGKTSILHHLAKWLPRRGGPKAIYFDLQDKAAWPVGKIMVELAAKIAEDLALAEPEPAGADAAQWFRRAWLPGVLAALPEGTSLAVLFDEFDVLADAASQKAASETFFSYLRGLLTEMAPRLRLVFVIGRNLEDLSYLAVPLFKTMPSKHVSLLLRSEAEALIRLSEGNRSLVWSEEAVEAAWGLTHGHPYLLQHVCWQVWQRIHAARARGGPERAAGAGDVEMAVPHVLDQSRNVLEWLWGGLPPAGRVVASALAKAGSGAISDERLHQVLRESGVLVVIRDLTEAPKRLQGWDLLEAAPGGHQFRVELLRRWIAEFKPLSRVQEELDKINPLAESLFQGGDGYYRTGKLGEAMSQFRAALEVNPNHLRAAEFLAEILISRNAWDEAQRVLEKLHENYPSAAVPKLVHVLLARAQGTSDDRAKIAILDQVLNLDASNDTALAAKRAIFKERGDKARAAGNNESALRAYRKAGRDDLVKDVVQDMRAAALARVEERLVAFERADQDGQLPLLPEGSEDGATGPFTTRQATSTVRVELELTTEARVSSTGTRFFPVVVGHGAYARVFSAKYRLVDRRDDGTSVIVEDDVVAKIFLDNAPEDYKFVFRREVDFLGRLRGHPHVVNLRAVEEAFPPTFVCGECGEVFRVRTCPECGGELENDSEHRLALRCRENRAHEYHKAQDEHRALLCAARSCGHKDECLVVNFLYRPCVFIDALDVNLAELNDLLQRPEYTVRGHRFGAAYPGAPVDETDRRRGILLVGLWCLVEVADTLAHVHAKGLRHADIAPENIMVRLVKSTDGVARSAHACVIDFGRARPLAKDRMTERPPGRERFCAPEMYMIKNSINGSLRFEGSVLPTVGQECRLVLPKLVGEPLSLGDYVWDAYGGEYTVLSVSEHEDGVWFDDSSTSGSRPSNQVRVLVCQLQVERAPDVNDPRELIRTQVWRNGSISVSTDIFALGCVIAWFLAGDLLGDTIRSAALTPRMDRPDFDDDLPQKYLADAYEPILAAIPLPDTPEDRKIKQGLLLTVFRCLLRRPGAYTNHRGSADASAAGYLSHDLRAIHDRLLFLHRTRSEFDTLFADVAHRVRELENCVATGAEAIAASNVSHTKEQEQSAVQRVRQARTIRALTIGLALSVLGTIYLGFALRAVQAPASPQLHTGVDGHLDAAAPVASATAGGRTATPTGVAIPPASASAPAQTSTANAGTDGEHKKHPAGPR